MILVTGATGFVGSATLRKLSGAHSDEVVGSVRRPTAPETAGARLVEVGDLTPNTDWSSALREVTAVVHTAARVHVMRDTARDPLTQYRWVNVEGTKNLARQAAAAGVSRFIFVSSVKVHGEATQPGRPFHADDPPAPREPYGVSKMEAEQGVREIAAAAHMELVIIRPPLVYGPGVRANFRSMMRWIRAGVPLPLGALDNRRSLAALDNLVDVIAVCVHHPAAANQAFLVSDGEDVSTTELLRRLGDALGKPARLLPVPAALVERALAVAGSKDLAQRLCGSLQADIAKTRRMLGWTPPVTLDEGLKRAAEGFSRETRH